MRQNKADWQDRRADKAGMLCDEMCLLEQPIFFAAQLIDKTRETGRTLKQSILNLCQEGVALGQAKWQYLIGKGYFKTGKLIIMCLQEISGLIICFADFRVPLLKIFEDSCFSKLVSNTCCSIKVHVL